MEKAQRVRKTRQEFINYPLVSMANEIFDWVLDEFDARTKVMNFDPIQLYVYKSSIKTTIKTTNGLEYKNSMIYFLQSYSIEELFAKLKDIVDGEDGFSATLNSDAGILNITIDII